MLTKPSSLTDSFQLIMKSLTFIFFFGFVMSFTPDAFSKALAGSYYEWKRNVGDEYMYYGDEPSDIQVRLFTSINLKFIYNEFSENSFTTRRTNAVSKMTLLFNNKKILPD